MVAEPGVHQPRLQAHPVRHLAVGRERRSEAAARGLIVSCDRAGMGQGDRGLRRGASPPRLRQRGLDVPGRRVRARLNLTQLLVQPGRNGPPGPGPVDDLHGHRRAPLGQRTTGRDQVGRRSDKLVRAGAESGVRLLEAAAGLA